MDQLLPACSKSGTSIICGGPFYSGILVGREIWNYSKAPKDIVEKAKALNKVVEEFIIPLAAAALQFPQANKIVTSVIPGQSSKLEFQDIMKWQNLKIPPEFWIVLKERNLLREDAPTP